ncbi:MAG: serine/threonine protein kinase [Cyclobacteriaceae bacterium]
MSNLAIIDHFYEQLLQHEQPNKEKFLMDLAVQHPDIHDQILQLLHDEEADDFFNSIEKEVSLSFQGKCYDIGSEIGNYRLEEIVGTGGMSFVYRASRTDGLFQRDSAIKIVRKGLDSAKIIQYFKQECHISAQLQHKNIARIYDGGITVDGLPYLVMEYIDGTDILEYCRQNQLDLNQRLKLFSQLCEAVQYCHDHEVIHCDLKPGNVLVNKKGEVKLTDFGIARHINNNSASILNTDQYRVLTLEYASPELKTGSNITPSSDIYQLGLLLYEMITLEKAYKVALKSVKIGFEKIKIVPIKNLLLHCVHQHADSRIDIEILLATLKKIISLIEKKNQVTNLKNRISDSLNQFIQLAAVFCV